MKNSNKFLLVALLGLLIALTTHNLNLRAEYRKGSYKDPLHDYVTLDFKNFSEIDLSNAGQSNVKIVAGPFNVRRSPRAANFVKVTQQGQRLVVTVDFAEKDQSLGWGETLVISCPRLTQLHTGSTYLLAGQPQPKDQRVGQETHVQGFRQDSLRVYPDQASNLSLAGNKLGFLRAVAGTTPGSTGGLFLEDNNRLGAADLTMQNRTELNVNNIAIAQAHCQFSDSAKVTLTGAALGSLLK